MKIVIYIMISVFCISCNGQNNQHRTTQNSTSQITQIDTVSKLTLRNKGYSSFRYTLLLLQLLETDELGYRIKKIVLTQNSKTIASTFLPNPEDVKNFSVTKIRETKNGFNIFINWGGGNYIYDLVYSFVYKNGQFYLNNIETNNYGPNTAAARKTKKINPPIPIDKFDIISYLNKN